MELMETQNPQQRLVLGQVFKGDKWIWMAIGFLALVSVVFYIGAANLFIGSGSVASGGTRELSKHIGMTLISVGAAVGFSRIHPKYYAGVSGLAVIFSAALVAICLMMGKTTNGAARWLYIGGFTFQPSELAKIALVAYVSKCLSKYSESPKEAFLRVLGTAIILCGPVMRENLSTSLLMAATWIFLLFIGRMPMKYILGIFGVVGTLGVAIVAFGDKPIVYGVMPRAKTWHSRVMRFSSSDEKDVQGKDYQAAQAEMAVAWGGLVGKGLGKSYMKNFLPMAYSDFIFSIILEEIGLFGLICVVPYIVLMWRAVVIARRCSKPFHIYTILGLSFMICLQAATNMCVATGVIPVTGQTLPWVSQGGSSGLLMGIAFGIILSISIHADEDQPRAEDRLKIKPKAKEEEEYYSDAEAVQF